MFWLASYPKSGSTWMRVFLTNLLCPDDQPAHINKLLNTYGANDNNLIEHYTPFEPSELTFSELQEIRIKLLASLPNQLEAQACLKIHQTNIDANTGKAYLSNIKEPLIYVVRNPLDVCISLAHHQKWGIDESIDFMNNDKAVLGSIDRFNQRLSPEFLNNWSQHYLSWKNTVSQMLLIRYEDMQEKGLETFSMISEHLGFDYTEGEIVNAISKSEINLLQKQEADVRFKEGSIANRNFFRKGISGEWKSILTSDQVERIASKHRAVMKELSYL